MDKTFFNWGIVISSVAVILLGIWYLIWLFATVGHNNKSFQDYKICIKTTHNVEGCDKEVYPEEYNENKKKEDYFRKHVPMLTPQDIQ